MRPGRHFACKFFFVHIKQVSLPFSSSRVCIAFMILRSKKYTTFKFVTGRRCTKPQTPTLSCVIFTCHSRYPTFYNWRSHLCRHSRLCLEQASSRNAICLITTCFQTSTENSSFRLRFSD